MAKSDGFAEFETDEATFNAMLEQAEPAELVPRPAFVTMWGARDAITFRQGLPLSIGNTASTVEGWPIQQSPIRPRPLHQTQPRDEVAG
ncbi:MAG: hypothetical protein ACRDQ4_01875 [Pseudonocardiaceae bacterium]